MLARELVANIKARFDIPSDVPLHMRLLYSGDARKKLRLSLDRALVDKLLSFIVDEMNAIPFCVQGTYYSGKLPSSDTEKNPIGPDLSVTWSIKGMQTMLASNTLINLNFHNYQYSDMQIIVAADTTRLKFLGKQRKQAHSWTGGFSSIGAPPGFVFHFSPIIQQSSNEPLLQIADAIVYLISHAFDPNNRNPAFPKILSNIRNIDVRPFIFKPDAEPN